MVFPFADTRESGDTVPKKIEPALEQTSPLHSLQVIPVGVLSDTVYDRCSIRACRRVMSALESEMLTDMSCQYDLAY